MIQALNIFKKANRAIAKYVSAHKATYEDMLTSRLGRSQFEALPVTRPGETQQHMRDDATQIYRQLVDSGDRFNVLYDRIRQLKITISQQLHPSPHAVDIITTMATRCDADIKRILLLTVALGQVIQKIRDREHHYWIAIYARPPPFPENFQIDWFPVTFRRVQRVNVGRVHWYRLAHDMIIDTLMGAIVQLKPMFAALEADLNALTTLVRDVHDPRMEREIPNFAQHWQQYQQIRGKMASMKATIARAEEAAGEHSGASEDLWRLEVQECRQLKRECHAALVEVETMTLLVVDWVNAAQMIRAGQVLK